MCVNAISELLWKEFLEQMLYKPTEATPIGQIGATCIPNCVLYAYIPAMEIAKGCHILLYLGNLDLRHQTIYPGPTLYKMHGNCLLLKVTNEQSLQEMLRKARQQQQQHNRKAKQHNKTRPKQSFFKEKLATSGGTRTHDHELSRQYSYQHDILYDILTI